jgi:rare lipoprotein A
MTRLSLALVLLLLLPACGAPRPPADHAPRPSSPGSSPAPGWTEEGEASWYGRPYHGRTTASGERYDMNHLTAAHPTLPFGTRVEVTRLDTGAVVVVRITDRGPFAHGRIIDLSRAAARALDMERDGVARVRVRVISVPP